MKGVKPFVRNQHANVKKRLKLNNNGPLRIPIISRGDTLNLRNKSLTIKKKSKARPPHHGPAAKEKIGDSKENSISLTGIQDEITINKNKTIDQNSIQDEITSRILMINKQFDEIIQLVYKLNQLSINQ